jgi:hypothetical protein
LPKYEVDVKFTTSDTMEIEADSPEDVVKMLKRIPDHGVGVEVEVLEVRLDGEPV